MNYHDHHRTPITGSGSPRSPHTPEVDVEFEARRQTITGRPSLVSRLSGRDRSQNSVSAVTAQVPPPRLSVSSAATSITQGAASTTDGGNTDEPSGPPHHQHHSSSSANEQRGLVHSTSGGGESLGRSRDHAVISETESEPSVSGSHRGSGSAMDMQGSPPDSPVTGTRTLGPRTPSDSANDAPPGSSAAATEHVALSTGWDVVHLNDNDELSTKPLSPVVNARHRSQAIVANAPLNTDSIRSDEQLAAAQAARTSIPMPELPLSRAPSENALAMAAEAGVLQSLSTSAASSTQDLAGRAKSGGASDDALNTSVTDRTITLTMLRETSTGVHTFPSFLSPPATPSQLAPVHQNRTESGTLQTGTKRSLSSALEVQDPSSSSAGAAAGAGASPSITSPGLETIAAVTSPEGLNALALRMVRELDIKDRSYLFRSFPQCFVGEEAVKWMLSSAVARTAPEAVMIGNAMLSANIIQHVTMAHKFKNAFLYYRFMGRYAELVASRNRTSMSVAETSRTSIASPWDPVIAC